jgi:hypothetical protein
MEEMTAIEWLYNQMDVSYAPDKVKQWFEQAKQMERQQIINAHLKGQREDIDFINEAKEEAEQYYNEAYAK